MTSRNHHKKASYKAVFYCAYIASAFIFLHANASGDNIDEKIKHFSRSNVLQRPKENPTHRDRYDYECYIECMVGRFLKFFKKETKTLEQKRKLFQKVLDCDVEDCKAEVCLVAIAELMGTPDCSSESLYGGNYEMDPILQYEMGRRVEQKESYAKSLFIHRGYYRDPYFRGISVADIIKYKTYTLKVHGQLLELNEMHLNSLEGIELIDEKEREKVHILDVRKNYLESLSYHLLYLPNLREIKADENYITSIDNAITLNKNLTKIMLSKNALSYIPSAFLDMQKLGYLGLQDNYITEEDKNGFMDSRKEYYPDSEQCITEIF